MNISRSLVSRYVIFLKKWHIEPSEILYVQRFCSCLQRKSGMTFSKLEDRGGVAHQSWIFISKLRRREQMVPSGSYITVYAFLSLVHPSYGGPVLDEVMSFVFRCKKLAAILIEPISWVKNHSTDLLLFWPHTSILGWQCERTLSARWGLWHPFGGKEWEIQSFPVDAV